jgi:AcrR family transcriptional regulator
LQAAHRFPFKQLIRHSSILFYKKLVGINKTFNFANGVKKSNNVMGSKERKLRQKEEVRCQIIAAAWKIVKEEGWQALSMRKIADIIEYSAPIIYGHFENKEALLFEFTRMGYAELLRMIKEAKAKYTDPAEQLEAMWMAYWDFAFANREYYQLMYGVEIGCCEMKSNIAEAEEGGALISDVLKQLIASSKHPDADPCLKFYNLWSVVHGLISINIIRDLNNINSLANIESTEGRQYENLNQAILKDAISGIISRIKG